MTLIANKPNWKRHIRNFPLQSRANGIISQNAIILIANSNTRYVIRVDLNDDWVGMEISIMAHKLPIEKYVFDNK